jgi:hypothetical protein
MTTKLFFQAIVLIPMLLGQLAPEEAYGFVGALGPSELTSRSHAVLIVRVTQVSESGELAGGEVLEVILGEVQPSSPVSFVYPPWHFEETWTEYSRLREDTCLLVFLRKGEAAGPWLPAYALRMPPGTGGARVATEEAGLLEGRQSFKRVECGQHSHIGIFWRHIMEWGEMPLAERSDLVLSSLRDTSGFVRKTMLDLLLADGKIDFDDREEVTDRIAEGIIGCVTDSDEQIRRGAMTAIEHAATSRKDLIPYLVEGLDDPDPAVRAIALRGLEYRVRGVVPGPLINATAEIDVKVDAWKDWWREKGLRIATFERFVPVTAKEKTPLPEHSRN